MKISVISAYVLCKCCALSHPFTHHRFYGAFNFSFICIRSAVRAQCVCMCVRVLFSTSSVLMGLCVCVCLSFNWQQKQYHSRDKRRRWPLVGGQEGEAIWANRTSEWTWLSKWGRKGQGRGGRQNEDVWKGGQKMTKVWATVWQVSLVKRESENELRPTVEVHQKAVLSPSLMFNRHKVNRHNEQCPRENMQDRHWHKHRTPRQNLR